MVVPTSGVMICSNFAIFIIIFLSRSKVFYGQRGDDVDPFELIESVHGAVDQRKPAPGVADLLPRFVAAGNLRVAMAQIGEIGRGAVEDESLAEGRVPLDAGALRCEDNQQFQLKIFPAIPRSVVKCGRGFFYD